MKLAHVTPAAPEIERAVVGALLLNPEAWPPVADLLHRDLFSSDDLRTVFVAMEGLWHQGKPIDLLTVAQAMRSDDLLTGIGGAVFLTELQAGVSGTRHLEYHIRILVEKMISRKLIAIGSKAERMGLEHPDSLEALDNLSSEVTDLYSLTQPTQTHNASDGVDALLDRTEPEFVTYGIPKLDEIAVLEAGVPSVYAGRPGMGKSIFSVFVLWHLTNKGNVLGFFPEMTRRQVQARILAIESGIPFSRIVKKALTDQELQRVTATWHRIHDRMQRLLIDDTSGVTPAQVRSRTERAMKTGNLVAIGIDHLHEMNTGDQRTDRDDFARVSGCMKGVTEIAKATGLPTLVICQLNRALETRSDKRPSLSDLRGTGAIEEKAAVVGLLFRPGYYEEIKPEVDDLTISIAKNRDGALGAVATKINLPLNRIGDEHITPRQDAAPF